MIKRKYYDLVVDKLENFAAVGLIGPRQVGKTTLAIEIAKSRPAIYLDLESDGDKAKLEDPAAYFDLHKGKLIILDEIQRMPDLFAVLRGQIDKGRREGKKYGQFLLLGSASLDLLRQSSESLAGRVTYVEMGTINPLELEDNRETIDKLWLTGGFPDSYTAKNEKQSLDWRSAFIKTYLERDIPQFGFRIPAETLKRLWVMLGHCQGTPINASMLATNLGVSGQTVARYIDLLTDLFLIRKLAPWHENTKKRLVKSPKIYVRDSGILHTLLNITSFETLLSHPIVGASWEGFVLDSLITFMPMESESYFYRTSRGAEVDLIIKRPDGRIFAIEVKRSSSPKIKYGFYEACTEINPTDKLVIYDGKESFPTGQGLLATSLVDAIKRVSS